MQEYFQLYYKQYGLLRPQQLLAPRLTAKELFHFPRASVLHFISHDPEVVAPDPSESYYVQSSRVMIEHVLQLTALAGKPHRLNVVPNQLVHDFQIKNRKFKMTVNPHKVLSGDLVLDVFNYGYLQSVYTYMTSTLTPYYQWYNIEKTAWDNIRRVAVESERQNFVICEVPDMLPSMTMLNSYSGMVNSSYLKIFDTPGKRMLLEIWKWMKDDKAENCVLAGIDRDALAKINIVFMHNSSWCVLNMENLYHWKKGVALKQGVRTSQMGTDELRKMFLKMLIGIQSPSLLPDDSGSTTDAEQASDNANNVGKDPYKKNQEDLPGVNRGIPETLPANSDGFDDGSENLDSLDASMSDIDKDLEALELMERKSLVMRGVRPDAGESEEKPAVAVDDASVHEAITKQVFQEKSINEALMEQVNKQADYGLMSATEYRNAVNMVENVKNITNPYKGTDNLETFATIQPHETLIEPEDIALENSSDSVIDKSMLKSTLKAYDTKYIKTLLPKDIVGMVNNIQRAGLVIRDYTIETDASILGEYENHTVHIKPVDGAPSILRWRIPKVDPEGVYQVSGNKYRLRKQRIDIPIRKVRPNKVSLTSYYGKVFIQRSEKKVNDQYNWLANQITQLSQSDDNSHIQKVNPANVFDNQFVAPKVYSAMAHYFKSIVVDNNHLLFDHKERLKLMDPAMVAKLEDKQAGIYGQPMVLCGVSKHQEPILVDFANTFYLYKDGARTPIGNIYSLVLMDETLAPVDSAEIGIRGKSIPIGVVLAYKLGLTKLMTLLKVKPRVVEGRQRLELASDEYAIVFKDKKLILSRKDDVATLILAGFTQYHKSIKNYFLESFDNQNVYLNVLESNGIGARYLREIDLMDQLFVDPVTMSILREMNEPLTFMGLIMRAGELLKNDYHPDAQDINFMRIRGYERFAGAIYKEMVASVREFKSRNIRGKSQVEMNPYTVWKTVTQDSAAESVKDINPIQNLKEQEIVTYVGEGGRSKESMDRSTRGFHISDIGVMSESSVDSGDVGINAYLSANPQFSSVRGLVKKNEKPGFTSMVSTTMLATPGVSSDAPNRCAFVNIQSSHVIGLDAYRQAPVRTGYESVIAQRTGEMFAYAAEQDGKVLSISPRGVILEYANGEKKGVELGRRFGKAEGSVYPHDILANVVGGQTFKKGHIIAYNKNFFEVDMMDPNNVIWKTSMVVKTVLYESSQTLEDSSAISRNLSNQMAARITKVKSFVVEFGNGVKNMLKPGTKLEPTDVLFVIEDELTNELGLFDEETLGTLQKLSNKAPKAKVRGVLDRIEVLYHGSKDDMSSSLKALANASDRELAEVCKAQGKPVMTGEVNEDYRVDGSPLVLDTAEIKVYITVTNVAGVGD